MLLALQIFFIICCVVMILVVLMQRSEGDGVAGMLGGGQGEAIFGTKTVNVLARFTAGLGVVMLILIIVLGKMSSSDKSLMDEAATAPVATEAATPATSAADTKAEEAKAVTAPSAEEPAGEIAPEPDLQP